MTEKTDESGWRDDGCCFNRSRLRFAWFPTITDDQGLIWLRPYRHEEKIWGWGFYDAVKYADLNVTIDT